MTVHPLFWAFTHGNHAQKEENGAGRTYTNISWYYRTGMYSAGASHTYKALLEGICLLERCERLPTLIVLDRNCTWSFWVRYGCMGKVFSWQLQGCGTKKEVKETYPVASWNGIAGIGSQLLVSRIELASPSWKNFWNASFPTSCSTSQGSTKWASYVGVPLHGQ